MADTKKLVAEITSMDEDFTQWYTDVCIKADLVSYSNIKGCMVIKPAGYAIWELIQKHLDARFKATGVQNAYLPMFIPESLLQKEKDHVEGFAPEVAWVTHGGLEPLTERYCVRPTSETLFCDYYRGEIHSYKDLPQVQLVEKMIGKDLEDLSVIKKSVPPAGAQSENFYEAEGLSSSQSRPFDFHIARGEVNGFTGLLGSGRSESVRAIFGADPVTGGSVKIEGKKAKIGKPLDAMKHGIGYLPEDRKRDGIIADLSVRDNIILALQVIKGVTHPFSRAKAEAFADEYIKALDIKTASSDTPIKSLSGGNQQKVILARWLLTHPQYLILDEPTRGIDVGTKTEIQKLVLKLAEEGMSITFISSEIEEMLRTCSRLIVMRDRNIVGELKGDELTQERVMRTIAGGGD